MLFRIEAAVLTGVTHPTCTMETAKWNVPSKKKVIKPGKLETFLVKQDHYMRKATALSTEEAKRNAKRKLDYTPMNDKSKNYFSDPDKARKDIFEKIKEFSHKSCFNEIMLNSKFSAVTERPQIETPNLITMAKSFVKTHNMTSENVVDNFVRFIQLNAGQIKSIYQNTIKQSESEEWVEQRKGRLTASKFKRIYTRMQSIKNDPTINPFRLVADILGEGPKVQTWQMKHGIATEVHAKKKYKAVMNKLQHKYLTFADPGMTVMSSHSFISASPDMEVECICHGKALVEIKCPATLIGLSPSAENYPYLIKIDGKVQLKSDSDYYYQIQGQMGVTGRMYTDFFVFTFNGYHLERIKFDQSKWERLLLNLDQFWRNFVAHKLLEDAEDNPITIHVTKPDHFLTEETTEKTSNLENTLLHNALLSAEEIPIEL